MKNHFTAFAVLSFALFSLTACEKPILDEEAENNSEQTTVKDENANLILRVSNIRQISYDQVTRAVVDITGYSSRLNFVLYQNGEQIRSLSQMQNDADYGQVALSLMPGTYKVLVLAHSCKGNPTLTDPENIKFTNSTSFSDTFYYYGDVTVGTEATTHDLTLTRASSLLRFIIQDNEIPTGVTKIHFYYTGGSGVLNALSGYGGNVDSRQEKLYNISGLTTPITLPIYTFLQSDEGKLQVKVEAKDNDNNVIVERTFSDIPMKRNMITEYSGAFFEHNNSFTFSANTEWDGTIEASY